MVLWDEDDKATVLFHSVIFNSVGCSNAQINKHQVGMCIAMRRLLNVVFSLLHFFVPVLFFFSNFIFYSFSRHTFFSLSDCVTPIRIIWCWASPHTGSEEETRARELAKIRQKLKLGNMESLDTPQLRVASDYFNDDEMAAFKKPSDKKKKKKIRKKMLKVRG